MQLTLDVDSDVPIYQQIRDLVVIGIATGELPMDSPLPSTRQLATDLAINFHTVNKAYDLLRREGFIRVNRKSGAVIKRGPDSGPPQLAVGPQWQARLRTLLAEAVAHGLSEADVSQHFTKALADLRPVSADLQR
jgi:GntR family transcriptional regulator